MIQSAIMTSGVWTSVRVTQLPFLLSRVNEGLARTETLMWSHPPMQGDIPPPCRAHSATAVMNQIILFGGGDGANYYNHLYLLDTSAFLFARPLLLCSSLRVARFRWTRFNPRGVLPPPRRAHTCVMWDKRIFVFGGGTGAQALGDLWSLDVTEHPDNWEWVCLRTNPEPLRVASKAKTEDDVYKRARVHDHGGVGPSPRGYHTAAAVHSKMVVVGGSNGSQCYNDVWIFDLGAKHLPYKHGRRLSPTSQTLACGKKSSSLTRKYPNHAYLDTRRRKWDFTSL